MLLSADLSEPLLELLAEQPGLVDAVEVGPCMPAARACKMDG